MMCVPLFWRELKSARITPNLAGLCIRYCKLYLEDIGHVSKL